MGWPDTQYWSITFIADPIKYKMPHYITDTSNLIKVNTELSQQTYTQIQLHLKLEETKEQNHTDPKHWKRKMSLNTPKWETVL